MRCEAADGGILNQGFLQGSQILWKVDVRTGFEHRAGKTVTEQAAERITKSEFGSHANAAEKAGAGAPKSDKIIAAVGTRAQHRVRGAQFFKRQPQHFRGEGRRVGPHHNHPRVLPEQLRECALDPLREVTTQLPPALECGRDYFSGERSSRRKHVAGGISSELCHLSQGIGNQRPVELCCSIRAQGGDQPRLGFSLDDRARKNRHGRRGMRCRRPPKRSTPTQSPGPGKGFLGSGRNRVGSSVLPWPTGRRFQLCRS